MGQGFNRGHEGFKLVIITAVGLQEGQSQRGSQFRIMGLQYLRIDAENTPYERIAVGMRPAGGQTQHHIPAFHIIAQFDLIFFHHSHDESNQVVVFFGVYPGHFRGFAADQGAACVPAGRNQSLYNSFNPARVEFTHSDIVLEEKGRRTADKNIIDAVVNDVNADGIVLVQGNGDFHLGAYAVDMRDQHGLMVAFQLVQTAEEAYAAQDLRSEGWLG